MIPLRVTIGDDGRSHADGTIRQVADRPHDSAAALGRAVTLPCPAGGDGTPRPAANGVSAGSRAGTRRGRAAPSPSAARTAHAAEPEVSLGVVAAARWG